MNRFFIDPSAIQGNQVEIPTEVSRQIRKVLRLKEGTHICLLDNQGFAYESKIHYLDENSLTVSIICQRKAEGEPTIPVTLFIALTQREKFEWILQKCTEAGVCCFIPVITARSIVRNPKDVLSKMERWNKIIQEASEQCERGLVPQLKPPVFYKEAINKPLSETVKIFFWEDEDQNQTLSQLIEPQRKTISDVALFIGPEGGFSPEEAILAKDAGWNMVSLGKRIFRMETAAIAASILTLYEIERQNPSK